MHITDIIYKKRKGDELTKDEIQYFIRGCVEGTIPDYQISALLMAVWFRGMNSRETTDLTIAMAESGDQIDLSAIPGIKVDKHSTGGVADTTTLITAPLVAAGGGKVAKMSGRGLGHTGGTLDKLESIPGFEVYQPMERFTEIVSSIGISIIGQTGNLVPADKKLYALRDVTVTIDNLSLIASSVMSKKLAAGSDAIVLDVKTGSGAFMKETEDSVELARAMVDIGKSAGKKITALVTDMNQPLGNAIGNALEVREAIEILQGGHTGDLRTVSLSLASQLLLLSGLADTPADAMARLEKAIASGEALEKFAAMIEAQNGNPEVTENIALLPRAREKVVVPAPAGGYVTAMNTEEIGLSAMLLGAGRATKEDTIDKAVGIWMKVRLGDTIERGEPLAELYINDDKNKDEAVSRFTKAVTIADAPAEKPELIYQLIS
jgi:pyrimidine-nucleoside phosphorylase